MIYRRDPNARKRRRLKGARLLEQGAWLAAVARRCGVSRPRASMWERMLKEKRPDGMKRRPLGGPQWFSEQERAELRTVLLDGALARGFAAELGMRSRLAKLIASRFGIEYSIGPMWHSPRSLGFFCPKPVRRVAQRDKAKCSAAQDRFACSSSKHHRRCNPVTYLYVTH